MCYISQADICWQDSSTVAGRAKDDPQEWYEFYRFSPPSQGLTDLLIRAVAGTYSVVSLADSQLVEERKKYKKSTAYLIYQAGSALKSFTHMRKTIDKSRNVQISL